jgi:hypothetical protein
MGRKQLWAENNLDFRARFTLKLALAKNVFDPPIREHVRSLRGSHLQGICNMPSSDGLLRSRCSPADGDQGFYDLAQMCTAKRA